MPLTLQELGVQLSDGLDGLNPGPYADLLADVQGNILKSHGRDHSVLLFVRWRPEQTEAARRWIAAFARRWVTSAARQFDEARHYRQTGEPGPVFGSVAISRQGYEALGFTGVSLPTDVPFRMGMQHDELAADLHDPPVAEWEPGYRQPCHALISLADDDRERLWHTVDDLSTDLTSFAEILQRENGFVLRNELGQAIEHFGYVDGLSQPLFASHDLQRRREAGERFDRWDPRAPLNLVLHRDPNGGTADSFGSYLVVRKLEQNVRRFNADVRALAERLNIDPALAGALTVGRFKDGTPLSEADHPAGETCNDFNFAADPDGRRCPFQAHVRKTNPRGDTVREAGVSDDEERGHRLVRRAVSYGSDRPDDEPETGSGLLFLCYQASIANQFQFMQSRWANPPHFVRVGTGTDPLVGQAGGPPPWVVLKGGAYLFAPSLSFLRSLAP